MDLVDIIAEKKFLGQEFLTWLWWKGENSGCEIATRGDSVSVVFDGNILLEDSQGEDKVNCSGKVEMPEAMTGLRYGKKIQQAKLRIGVADLEFVVTLTADLLEFKAVKLPKTIVTVEAGEGEEEGLILERIYLFETLRNAVHDLFHTFVRIRVSPEWGAEQDRIAQWIEDSAI